MLPFFSITVHTDDNCRCLLSQFPIENGPPPNAVRIRFHRDKHLVPTPVWVTCLNSLGAFQVRPWNELDKVSRNRFCPKSGTDWYNWAVVEAPDVSVDSV